MRSAASNLKRLPLELGGNDAGIILPDADLDSIAEAIFQTAFLNMGQTCAALKRLYVHDSQYDALREKLTAIATVQVVGNGMDRGVAFGPIQNKEQFELVRTQVDDARANACSLRWKIANHPPTRETSSALRARQNSGTEFSSTTNHSKNRKMSMESKQKGEITEKEIGRRQKQQSHFL